MKRWVDKLLSEFQLKIDFDHLKLMKESVRAHFDDPVDFLWYFRTCIWLNSN